MIRSFVLLSALMVGLLGTTADVTAATDYSDPKGIKAVDLIKACESTNTGAVTFCSSYIWGAVDYDNLRTQLLHIGSVKPDDCGKFLYEDSDRGALVEKVARFLSVMGQKKADGTTILGSESAPASDAILTAIVAICGQMKLQKAKQPSAAKP